MQTTEFKQLYELLSSKLSAANYQFATNIQEQLTNYLLLLSKWNKAYNLTSIDNPAEMIVLHILDSLSIASYINGQKILDVGTGAGLPGIPLALIYPNKEFYLLDSNGKKTRFLLHVVQTLKLHNVNVIQERVEKYQPDFCFDNIVSRAFSSLDNFIQGTKHLCCVNGEFLAMKGTNPITEITELEKEYSVIVYPLEILELTAERHLVCVKKK